MDNQQQQQMQQTYYRPLPGLWWVAGVASIAMFSMWVTKTMWQREIDYRLGIPQSYTSV